MSDYTDQAGEDADGREISNATAHTKEVLFRLSEKYQLSRDALQWIVERRRGQDKKTGKEFWEGIIFVRHDKKLMIDRMAEKGVQITPAGWEGIRGLPEHFQATA